ncbi:hypothetical protein B0H19DRAFT_422021 [Mycena capillaripes]|nr:hypothetical protein B0H19DRAFT_422021 [Mycena capillaripes]
MKPRFRSFGCTGRGPLKENTSRIQKKESHPIRIRTCKNRGALSWARIRQKHMNSRFTPRLYLPHAINCGCPPSLPFLRLASLEFPASLPHMQSVDVELANLNSPFETRTKKPETFKNTWNFQLPHTRTRPVPRSSERRRLCFRNHTNACDSLPFLSTPLHCHRTSAPVQSSPVQAFRCLAVVGMPTRAQARSRRVNWQLGSLDSTFVQIRNSPTHHLYICTLEPGTPVCICLEKKFSVISRGFYGAEWVSVWCRRRHSARHSASENPTLLWARPD